MATYSLNPNIEKSKIISKTVTKEVNYKILKYDEKYVCDNDEEIGRYRSVIFSEPEGKLLCYTPPKSVTSDFFSERNPDINNENIVVTEVIEGTMLSLFWDERINSWELASKGSIGGNYWFFRTQYEDSKKESQRTFREMFLEAFRQTTGDLNNNVVIKKLYKGVCYNFVLQHPDNHIVLTVQQPRVVLVSVYEIDKETNTATFISQDEYQKWFTDGIIEFPKELRESCLENYRENYCSIQSSYKLPGIMFLNKETGDRACIENPAYSEVKILRGNHPNLHYQYLCLRRINKVEEFLQYFPQYNKTFHRFFNQFESFVTNTHQSYLSYYIKKEGKQISQKYFPVIYKLHHEIYLPSLSSEEKIIMKKAEVRKGLLTFAPSYLFYYLQLEV